MSDSARSKSTPAEILLVEDNPGDVVLMQNSFKHTRFSNHITVATDGDMALAILRRQPPYAAAVKPDLILLDINMPRKSGMDVLNEIKKDDALKSIPVIMLTSSRANTDILDSAELNANGYIVKPITMEKLSRALVSLEGFSFTLVAARGDRK